MNSSLCLRLNADPAQTASLARLQAVFAEVCSALAPVVRDNRCWNRVTLHHLMYRKLRETFPDLGSQMVCNAIYSVSRTARLLFQNPASPWHLDRRPGLPLPLLRFAASAPVYFDRHTLSLRDGRLSMYTLDGRLRFEVGLQTEDEQRFRDEKLKEVVLKRDAQGFFLFFSFGDAALAPAGDQELPEYVVVLEDECTALAH